MGCSPRRAIAVEPGLCIRPYTVYARQVKREQASEWWAECATVGEQPGVPFYRPISRDVPLAYLLASNDIAMVGCLGGAART
jgi:hypothetical protein